MTVRELELAVSRLSAEELAQFSNWFEEYLADRWDERIEADARSGHLDHMPRQAGDEFEGGRCSPR